MDENIKRLIKSEEEAKKNIEKSLLYKDKMKKQALHDAHLELQLFESENLQKLEDIKSENEQYLQKIRSKLESEFIEFKTELQKKDTRKIIEALISKVSE